jgi:tRNA pseudouridine38-40 synthase
MTAETRYFFRVEYDGTAYHGWQRQTNGISVQQLLESAITTVTRQPCVVSGGGRTDAGVHALRQGAHVDLTGTFDMHTLQRSINAVLPPDIAVHGVQPAPAGFHARFSAVERHYRYTVVRRKTPLQRDQAWLMTFPVDWERVRAGFAATLGTHDFSAFCAAGSSVEEPVCTVRKAGLEQVGDQWVFSIAANRFVYRMVRSIVGTAVHIGRGGIDDTMEAILRSCDRSRAGPSAPARGLVLYDVVYQGVDA